MITESETQRANTILSAQIQPKFFLKNGEPRNFKQMKAYLNVIGFNGEKKKVGIYLYLVVHNQTLKRKLNGIGMLRVTLDGWTLKNFTQYIECVAEINKRAVGEKNSSVEKITRFPRYWEFLKAAKEKKGGKIPKGRQLVNYELRADIRKAWGLPDEPITFE